MYFQPQLNHKLTRHKRKTSTLEFLTFFFPPKFWEWSISSTRVKTRPWTHRFLPAASRRSLQLSSNPSGCSRTSTVHFSNPCCQTCQRLSSFNHILLLPGVASVNAAFRFGTVCVCVVQGQGDDVCDTQRTCALPWLEDTWLQTSAPGDEINASFHEELLSPHCPLCSASVSSSSHPDATAVPQQSHNNHTTIPLFPPRRLLFFL